MNSRDYWAEREAEALKDYITEEKEYSKRINEIYEETLQGIQSEIDAFYRKYATDNKISLREAKKRVRKLDIAEYERKAKRYVKNKDFSKKANEEMRIYNLTMKINRLEMLKANIGLEQLKGASKLERFFYKILNRRALKEYERQAGILGKSVRDNAKLAHAVVNASFRGMNFSDRIWTNSAAMKADLDRLITTGLIRGKNPRVLAREMRKHVIGGEGAVGAKYHAERLMRTELARVQTEAQKQSMEENGFELYQFFVNGGCCSACEEVAKKKTKYGTGVYRIKDLQPGLNAAPIHPNCRCSIAPYEDSDEYKAWLDFLDKGGTTEEWGKRKKQKSTPEIKLDNMGLNVYTKDEINSIAKEADRIAGKYVSRASKWSGDIVVNDKIYGKLWNCDISTLSKTSGHILLHEQLHSRSVSYFDVETYNNYREIEEASVQLLTQEICKIENIEIPKSAYDSNVDNLRKINSIIKIAKTDFDFATELFEIDLPKRLDWLEDKISSNFNSESALETYMLLHELMKSFYGE